MTQCQVKIERNFCVYFSVSNEVQYILIKTKNRLHYETFALRKTSFLFTLGLFENTEVQMSLESMNYSNNFAIIIYNVILA